MTNKKNLEESKCESNSNDTNIFINKCIHDIRNFRTLTKNQLEKINCMDFNSREQVLNTYNEVVSSFTTLIEELK
jgi:hypothetical protein